MKKHLVYSVKRVFISPVGEIEIHTIHARGVFLYCYFMAVIYQFLHPKKSIKIK